MHRLQIVASRNGCADDKVLAELAPGAQIEVSQVTGVGRWCMWRAASLRFDLNCATLLGRAAGEWTLPDPGHAAPEIDGHTSPDHPLYT